MKIQGTKKQENLKNPILIVESKTPEQIYQEFKKDQLSRYAFCVVDYGCFLSVKQYLEAKNGILLDA